MASLFNSLSLFNSGPHRFTMDTVGRYVIGQLRPPDYSFTSSSPVALELGIKQTGRLIADTTSAMWTQIDAIRTIAESTTAATLIDHYGRYWPGMRLVRFTLTGPMDRGRMVSQAYEAEYHKVGG